MESPTVSQSIEIIEISDNNSILCLQIEIIHMICDFLTMHQILNLSLCCKKLRILVDSGSVFESYRIICENISSLPKIFDIKKTFSKYGEEIFDRILLKYNIMVFREDSEKEKNATCQDPLNKSIIKKMCDDNNILSDYDYYDNDDQESNFGLQGTKCMHSKYNRDICFVGKNYTKISGKNLFLQIIGCLFFLMHQKEYPERFFNFCKTHFTKSSEGATIYHDEMYCDTLLFLFRYGLLAKHVSMIILRSIINDILKFCGVKFLAQIASHILPYVTNIKKIKLLLEMVPDIREDIPKNIRKLSTNLCGMSGIKRNTLINELFGYNGILPNERLKNNMYINTLVGIICTLKRRTAVKYQNTARKCEHAFEFLLTKYIEEYSPQKGNWIVSDFFDGKANGVDTNTPEFLLKHLFIFACEHFVPDVLCVIKKKYPNVSLIDVENCKKVIHILLKMEDIFSGLSKPKIAVLSFLIQEFPLIVKNCMLSNTILADYCYMYSFREIDMIKCIDGLDIKLNEFNTRATLILAVENVPSFDYIILKHADQLLPHLKDIFIFSCRFAQLSVIKKLLALIKDNNIDITQEDIDNAMIFGIVGTCVSTNRCIEFIEFISEKLNINPYAKDSFILYLVCKSKNVDLIKFLIDKYPNFPPNDVVCTIYSLVKSGKVVELLYNYLTNEYARAEVVGNITRWLVHQHIERETADAIIALCPNTEFYFCQCVAKRNKRYLPKNSKIRIISKHTVATRISDYYNLKFSTYSKTTEMLHEHLYCFLKNNIPKKLHCRRDMYSILFNTYCYASSKNIVLYTNFDNISAPYPYDNKKNLSTDTQYTYRDYDEMDGLSDIDLATEHDIISYDSVEEMDSLSDIDLATEYDIVSYDSDDLATEYNIYPQDSDTLEKNT